MRATANRYTLTPTPQGNEVPDHDTDLRLSFDAAADLYLKARPQYPEALYRDLLETCAPGSKARLLEVGCGPGVATRPIAEHGYQIDALDPGEALLERAAAHLDGLNVRLISADFESLDPPATPYDLIYSATAWHWTDPDTRYTRAHAMLQPGGYLTFWEARHVLVADGDPIFVDLQPVYDEIEEGLPPGASLPSPKDMPTREEEITASGLFEIVRVERYDWETRYSASAYVDLLKTFSNHILMAPWKQARLFSAIEAYVAARNDEPIRRHWGCVLHIARKR